MLFSGEDEASLRDALFHQSVDDVMAHLERQERFEHLEESLTAWVEHREHPPGSAIVEKDEPVEGLYPLTRGTATEIDPESGTRLRAVVQGSVIAPAAAFDRHTARTTIRADSDCRTTFLSPDARRLLEREDPNLALALHGFLVGSSGR